MSSLFYSMDFAVLCHLKWTNKVELLYIDIIVHKMKDTEFEESIPRFQRKKWTSKLNM